MILEEKELPLWVPVPVSQRTGMHAPMLVKRVTSLLPSPAVSVTPRASHLQRRLAASLLFKRTLVSDIKLVRTLPTMQPVDSWLKIIVVRGLGYVKMLEEKDLPLWVPVPVSQKTQMTPMS